MRCDKRRRIRSRDVCITCSMGLNDTNKTNRKIGMDGTEHYLGEWHLSGSLYAKELLTLE